MRRFLFLFLLTMPIASHSKDVPVKFLYTPNLTIPKQIKTNKTTITVPTKILIDKNGQVLKIFFPNEIESEIEDYINKNFKYAKFTPYYKNGVAIKSIVPFNIKLQEDTTYYFNEE